MNGKVLIEAFGYLGSALVVVSMLMSSVVRLRVINLTGSLIFAIYALIIKSYPTALMNVFLVSINIYHLMRLRDTGRHYDLFEDNAGDGYLNYLAQYYRDDIVKYFPDFSTSLLKEAGTRIFVVCCDHEVAGVLAGRQNKDELEAVLDYSTPVYRDCSVGAYLFEKLPGLGIRKILYSGGNQEHIRYVEKMGFQKTGENTYVKNLK